MVVLREPLVHLIEGESWDDFAHRAIHRGQREARSATYLARWRIEVSTGFGLRDGKEQRGASLWVERGTSSESWQKVTPTIYGDSWADLLGKLGEAFDMHLAELREAAS